jgi:hypothetical protein
VKCAESGGITFRQVVEMMIAVFERNLEKPGARDQALALVSLCVGAMVVARAIDQRKLADDIRDAARGHLVATTGWASQ